MINKGLEMNQTNKQQIAKLLLSAYLNTVKGY